MSDTVIRVENLSKKYVLSHQQEGNGRNKTLRDSITQGVESLSKKLLKHGGKTYNSTREEFWALKDVSFEIKQGDRVGIIGRNGAGKSTLLKILSRIVEPTSGRIGIQGRVASLLEVGTGFHPELTGRENIFLNGAILGMSKVEIKRKFDEIVAFAEVEKFLDTPVKRYSSGMYVRLAFAVAAHLEPEILIVDEVLAVGDATFQKKCLGKMQDVAGEGRTVLFVSHNMPSVQALCQRVIWLQKGSLNMSGEPQHIISRYLSAGINLNESEVDLSEHPGRSHSQEPALRKAWILNSEGIISNSIVMGESVDIYVNFECSRKIINPAFGFGIEDEYGKRIFSLNNYITGNWKKSTASGVACFRIPHIPILPGNYFVSLSLVEDQTTWIDFIEQAIVLEIVPADVFGSGKILERSQGVIYVNGEILINEEINSCSPKVSNY